VLAYDDGDTSLQTLMQSLFAAQPLGATWTTQGAFIIFLPDVTGDCAIWKKNAGDRGERRFCATEGMYIMNGYTAKDTLSQSPRMHPDSVKSWLNFNIGKGIALQVSSTRPSRIN